MPVPARCRCSLPVPARLPLLIHPVCAARPGAAWYRWSQEDQPLADGRAGRRCWSHDSNSYHRSNQRPGPETARRLIAAGHVVYLGARDAQRGKEVAADLGASR